MSKITKTPTGLRVPDAVTIPFIAGDGIGKEISPVCRAVVDAAVKQAFKGNRSIEWLEVEAGQEAFKKHGRNTALTCRRKPWRLSRSIGSA